LGMEFFIASVFGGGWLGKGLPKHHQKAQIKNHDAESS
jgi:hypothetical protein